MMLCPHCEDVNDLFDIRLAKNELKDYRKNGARKTTRFLLETLKSLGVQGMRLLDIGGGVGAIPHDLMNAGLAEANNVDASRSYIQVSQEEAERLGHAEKMQYQHGDFVQIAPEIESSDIVTLDRVVCCYPDVEALVSLSAERAKHYYGLVFPRDNVIFRIGIPIVNFFMFQLQGKAFKVYIHDRNKVDSLIRAKGLDLHLKRNIGFWQVYIYKR